MKRFSLVFVTLLLCVVATAQTPKYVFYFIGDGMGINQVKLADMYLKLKGSEEGLSFYNFPVQGFINTECANCLVTDSAAAGSALATGQKANWFAIGLNSEGNPIANIAEMAQTKGIATGVATNVGVNHATPSGFFGHVEDRDMYEKLAQQLIDSKLDFAAGANFLKEKGGKGYTPAYWIDKAREAGIHVYCGKQEYQKSNGRVIYLGDDLSRKMFKFAIDQKETDTSLADFTAAAVEHLYATGGKKGFFLMVEGGTIDYTLHSDDAATSVQEIAEMDKSVRIALEFYRRHPNETLIVVTADHETGGLSMSSGEYRQDPEFLLAQKISMLTFDKKINDLVNSGRRVEWTEIKDLLRADFGLWDTIQLSGQQEVALMEEYGKLFLTHTAIPEGDYYSSYTKLSKLAMEYVNIASGVFFAVNTHTNAPVPFYVLGRKASEFESCRDNTDIPKTIARVARY